MKTTVLTVCACFGAFILTTANVLRAADDAPANPPASQPAAESSLDRFEALVNKLKLDDEQKPKVEIVYEAREAYKALEKESDAKVREQKGRAISADLRQSLADVLTNDQKQELIKRMPQPIDTDAMIDRIKKELTKPERKLTDEQITKVDEILDDTKKKLAELRADSQENKTDNRAKIQAVLADMRKKLNEVLSAPPKV